MATDLLSRGIDVEGIAWVINFDMPFLPRVARSDDEGNMTDTGVRWPCVFCGCACLWHMRHATVLLSLTFHQHQHHHAQRL